MKTEITTHLKKAAELLEKGEVVAIPTETVYGLAANALDPDAVKKIFEAKERPHFNPLIIHIPDAGSLHKYVSDVPRKALELANRFWPGPLTMVLPKKDCVPEIVTAGKPTVAVRVPSHPIARDLLYMLDFPLAAPSANPFGQISPTNPSHVLMGLEGRIPLILDGGNSMEGIESTIVTFDEQETVVLLRPGSITIELLEKCVGEVKYRTTNNIDPEAPGMLDRHYSPNTPSFLVDDPEKYFDALKDLKVGLLSLKSSNNNPENVTELELSKNGDLKEASTNLYERLHTLDRMGFDVLLLTKLPDLDLGLSLNDRLKRAAMNEKLLINYIS